MGSTSDLPGEAAAGEGLAAVAGTVPALCQPRTGQRNRGPNFPNSSTTVPLRISVVNILPTTPASTSVRFGHPAALGASLGVGPAPKVVCQSESATPPSSPFLLGTASPWSNLAAIPPHLCRGKPRQKCSGQPGCSRPGCWRRQSPDKPALDCAGLRPASAAVRHTLIPGAVPVREERRTPHHRHPALTPLSRSGSGRGGRLPTAQCRSLSGSGSLRSPSPGAAKARHSHHTRPPPRPRSTAFRALGH